MNSELFRAISAIARKTNPDQYKINQADSVETQRQKTLSQAIRDTAANSMKYYPARAVTNNPLVTLVTDILAINDTFNSYEKENKAGKKTYTTDGPQSSTTDGAIFDKWHDENKRQQTTESSAVTQEAPAQEDDSEIIEYTYKPGDTLGQILLNLGLSDGSDLWTPGGAVDYYTEQLHDQGIWGNVPIGTTIRLKRRK